MYVVIAIDTEGPVDLHRNPPTTYNNVALVMDNSFRDSHTDSFGTPFKMTWYDHMSALIAYMSNGPDGPLWVYNYDDETPTGVSGCLALYDILHKNWQASITKYGDEDGYHHHFMRWTGSGPHAGWEEYDAGASDPSYTDHMDTIDHMIIDNRFFPSTWRTGWLVETDALSAWLEQWIPFDYTPSYSDWYPWHPSGMNRLQTRAEYYSSQGGVDDSFARARDYGSALYAFYCHDWEDMRGNIDNLQTFLDNAVASGSYPGVKFKYVTASEAVKQILGYIDLTPPLFAVTRSGNTYTVASNEPLWANHPYIALKYTNGKYAHIEATPTATNTWTVIPQTQQVVNEENAAIRSRGDSIPILDATSSVTPISEGYEPWRAIDGIYNLSSYWAGSWGDWLQLDLGSVKTLSTVQTHFWDGDDRIYRYYIETSSDGLTWTQVTTEKDIHGLAIDVFSSEISTQYIRIHVTHNTENQYVHIVEAYVYTASHTTASSYSSSYPPEMAIDGIESTSNYWEAAWPCWLQLDLGSPVLISKTTTHFYDGDSRYYNYYIQVSDTGLDGSWTTIVPEKSGRGSVTDTFPELTTRFVRVWITYNSQNPGAHIEELKIYRIVSTTTAQVAAIGIAANDLYGNAGVLVIPDQAARVESCDYSGSVTNQFNPSETVYVCASGLTPDTDYDLYIVQDPGTWTEGQVLVRVADTTLSVHTDSSGNLSEHTVAWNPTLTPGKYDIVIDVNQNHKYDSAYDVIEDQDIEITRARFADVYNIYIIGKAWNTRTGETGFIPEADINEDGVINEIDLGILSIQYGKDR